MKDQSQCTMTTSISQNRVRLNETKFSPAMRWVEMRVTTKLYSCRSLSDIHVLSLIIALLYLMDQLCSAQGPSAVHVKPVTSTANVLAANSS